MPKLAGALDADVFRLLDLPVPAAATDAIRRDYVESRGLQLVTNGSGLMGSNYNFTAFTFDPAETHGGGGSFRINVSQQAKLSDELIPIDPSRYYRLIGWAKSGDASGANFNAANRQYFGIAQYDIDGLAANPSHTQKFLGSTDTTLAVALNPNDTTITLVNATGWHNGATTLARRISWWPYTNAKGYTWPDYTYTRNVTAGGTWAQGGISGNVITLAAPWSGPALPAGTKVRNAADGGSAGYKYIAASNVIVPNAWTRYEGYLGGLNTAQDTSMPSAFDVGVAYLKLLFLINYHAAADNNVRWSDLMLTDVSMRNLEQDISVGRQLLIPTSGSTGGLVLGGDANLYRSAADILRTDDNLQVALALSTIDGQITATRSVAGSGAFAAYLTGGAQPKFKLTPTALGALLEWSDGANPADVNLYRSAADILKTDDAFEAASVKSGGQAVVVANDARLTDARLPSGPAGGDLVGTYPNPAVFSDYEIEVLLDTPALYWRLGESSGTIAADESGNNRTGTYTNATLNQPGAVSDPNTGIFLNNINAGFGNYSVLSTYSPFSGSVSVECWLKRSSIPGEGRIWTDSGGTIYFRADNANDNLRFGANAASVVWNNAFKTDGLWHHIVLVYDDVAKTVELFRDGTSLGSQSWTVGWGTTPGNFTAGDVGYGAWYGQIDEVAVYRSVLSAARIQKHYQVGQSLTDALYIADRLGIAVAPSDNTQLYIAGTIGDWISAASTAYGIAAAHLFLPINKLAVNFYGGDFIPRLDASSATGNFTSFLYGLRGLAQYLGGGTARNLANLVGVRGEIITANAAGSVTNATPLYSAGSVAMPVTNYYGVRINAPTLSGGGTLATVYGLYIPSYAGVVASGTVYAIYVAGGNSRFDGALGLNVAPGATGKLFLPAGTTPSDGIAFGTDVNLYRLAAGILITDTELRVGGVIRGMSASAAFIANSAPGNAYTAYGAGNLLRNMLAGADPQATFLITGPGVHQWGVGGTTPADTNLYRQAADVLATDDDLAVNLAGKGLKVKEGTNAKMGRATLVAGTVTVATTAVTAASEIFLTCQTPGGTPGFLRVSARTAGTNFTILSSSNTDTSVVAWMIVEPA